MIKFFGNKSKQVKTVGQILEGFQKTIDDLKSVEVYNREQVSKEMDIILKAHERQTTATNEANHAKSVVEKIQTLIG